MENFYSRVRQSKIFGKLPKVNEIEKAITSFSKKEWIVFSVLVAILTISTLAILQSINKSFLVSVPMKGGIISEGIIGTPRFINPVLALSDTDNDLTTLIYSGLMRKNQDGDIVPDLAEKIEPSKDGLAYTVTLKDKIFFHDDAPITADDVIFTVNAVKDPIIKSPHKSDWDGISVEKVDEKNIKFVLKQPYASFLDNLTLGIMPEKVWANSPIELNDANTNPVGSGPYMISKVNKTSGGTIDSYELVPFKKFILEEPYLKNLNLYFYTNENSLITAYENGTVDQISSITPENAKILKERNYRIESAVLPRVFGLFFNQNQNQIFTNRKIREAIDKAIDKERIVNEVLQGYGIVLENPIPPNIISYEKLSTNNEENQETRTKKAVDLLAKDGWKVGTSGFLEKTTTVKKKKTTQVLEFSISTGNTPDLVKSAELIKQDLTAIGMKVDVKTFDIGNLNQGVIRPRKYDVLLFGQIINHESNLIAFWHSSQRNDPGLNVAMYTNAKVDKILESAFVTTDEKARVKKYAQFEDEIKKDIPAVFLYSPNFIYAVSKNIQGLNIDHITSPSNRFLNSYSWYTEVDNVWKIFTNNK
ncbi:MAG: ABC transporter substrate-binding protein [Candidatus Paceibacterota bacterium]|jgi:peptide/nickel transport system substrate-binding protein